MRYKEELIGLNFWIKAAIVLDNELYELAIETRYSNLNIKAELQPRYNNYCSRGLGTNTQPNNSYKTLLIDLDLSQQCRTARLKRKEKNNKTCYTYSKLGHFVNDRFSNNTIS